MFEPCVCWRQESPQRRPSRAPPRVGQVVAGPVNSPEENIVFIRETIIINVDVFLPVFCSSFAGRNGSGVTNRHRDVDWATDGQFQVQTNLISHILNVFLKL